MQHAYNNGTLEKLLKVAFPDQIAAVVIPSEREQSTVTANLQALLREIPVPQERVYTYVPPESVSSCPYYYRSGRDAPRQEIIPDIPDPGHHFVVIDCTADTGRTFESAVEMLKSKSVDERRIWFLGNFNDSFIPGLYRARDLLDLTAHTRKKGTNQPPIPSLQWL